MRVLDFVLNLQTDLEESISEGEHCASVWFPLCHSPGHMFFLSEINFNLSMPFSFWVSPLLNLSLFLRSFIPDIITNI